MFKYTSNNVVDQKPVDRSSECKYKEACEPQCLRGDFNYPQS